MGEKRSDVVWIISDIVFSTSDIVFPMSYVVFGAFGKRQPVSRPALFLYTFYHRYSPANFISSFFRAFLKHKVCFPAPILSF